MSATDDAGFVLPTGTVAFLLTDVEGSTQRWETEPDAMTAAMDRHRAILDAAISARGGVCPPAQGEGDSVVAAFARPSDAVLAARDAQRALVAEEWPTSLPLRVRMAVHAGEARFVDDGSYAGQAIIRTARLRSIAHGGQVLVSAAARDLTIDQVGVEVELIDVGEHRLRDLARPERVFQLKGAGLLDRFPALLSLDAHPNNLPVQLSTFIGRVAEIDAVAGLLRTSRLVTITGVGGAGKTRLAQRVAAEVLDRHPDGAWWVELADLRNTNTLIGTLAAAVGAKVDSGDDNLDRLADQLRERRMLVVLDNCEHLVDDVAGLVDRLLRRAPNVFVLATSREPLAVDGEVTWRIPPLSTPQRGDQTPIALAALSQFDSVQLFLDRARRARSNFRLDDTNAADVAEICQRLDGIPLAIELAAARCRSLTPQQIRSGLNDAFRILTGNSRAVLPRHQTLEASIRWSHDLLTTPEQTLLRRLGVFSGGCTLDDAEAVTTDDTLPARAVLDLLDRLVAQSLVQLDDTTATPRYRLLETVRLYATQRLTDAGEADSFRFAHAHHFHHLAVSFGPRLEGKDDERAFGRLVPEVDNIGAGLDTLASLERWEDYVDVFFSAVRLWPLVGGADAARRLTRCLERADRLTIQHRARALFARSSILSWLGDAMGSVADATVVLELSDEPFVRGRALTQLATSMAFFDTPAADPLFLQAEAELSASGDRYGVAEAQTYRFAVWSCFRSDMVRGAEVAALATPLVEESGGLYLRAYAAGAGSIARCLRSEFTDAISDSIEAERCLTQLARAAGVDPDVLVDSTLVGTMLRYGRSWARLMLEGPQGVARFGAEVGRAHDHGDIFTECLYGLFDCLWLAASGDIGPTVDEAERLALLTGAVGGKAFEANFWCFAAEAARQLGDLDRAADLIGRADEVSEDISPTYVLARSAVVRARLALARGDLGPAEDLIHEALAIAGTHQLRYDVGIALGVLVGIEVANHAGSAAARLGGAVRRLWSDLAIVCSWDESFAQLTNDLDAARTALGDEAFAVAYAEGEALDLSEALAYARRARGERRRPAFGWDALTPTEERVADEVAKGATNPDIASALLMSRETVKTHLSHIFTKLGVKTRSELAVEVAARRRP